MWKYLIAAILVVALYLFFMHAFTVGEVRRPHVIHVKNTLLPACLSSGR